MTKKQRKNDQDGYCDDEDCNDEDASINPGATEICFDKVDNNCDGRIDEWEPGGCGFFSSNEDQGTKYSMALWLFMLIGLSSFRRFRKK